jgi:hypothetical protein
MDKSLKLGGITPAIQSIFYNRRLDQGGTTSKKYSIGQIAVCSFLFSFYSG